MNCEILPKSVDSSDDVILLNSIPASSKPVPNPQPKITEQDCGIEKFAGKIVYSQKGSAYIIDDNEVDVQTGGYARDQEKKRKEGTEGDLEQSCYRSGLQPLEESPILKPLLSPLRDQLRNSNSESETDVASQNNSEHKETNRPSTPNDTFGCPPRISNAFYVTRSAAYYNSLYGQAYAKMLRERMVLPTPDSPIVHSYRVYSMREDSGPDTSGIIFIVKQR